MSWQQYYSTSSHHHHRNPPPSRHTRAHEHGATAGSAKPEVWRREKAAVDAAAGDAEDGEGGKWEGMTGGGRSDSVIDIVNIELIQIQAGVSKA